MTGAPKSSSMRILETIEKHPREIYSGCVGYLSINSCFDLNIVIRTAYFSRWIPSIGFSKISVGAGGAITYLSHPSSEYEEVLLKSSALLDAMKVI